MTRLTLTEALTLSVLIGNDFWTASEDHVLACPVLVDDEVQAMRDEHFKRFPADADARLMLSSTPHLPPEDRAVVKYYVAAVSQQEWTNVPSLLAIYAAPASHARLQASCRFTVREVGILDMRLGQYGSWPVVSIQTFLESPPCE